MNAKEKKETLKDNHLSEWLKTRRSTEDELSQKQSIFCVCGKLASGFHEKGCTKFNLLVEKETMKKLEHLIGA